MSRFDYHQPASVEEAVSLAARFREQGRFLAGGTNLLVQIERGRVAPRHVIALQDVPGLTGIEADGGIMLGRTSPIAPSSEPPPSRAPCAGSSRGPR